MFQSLVVTGLSIARERELGTFDQLLVSPVSPFEIVIAKSVPAFILATLQAMHDDCRVCAGVSNSVGRIDPAAVLQHPRFSFCRWSASA